MDKAYWLRRKRDSLAAAQNAVGAEARLIHYELAGRYSLNAAAGDNTGVDVTDALPPPIYDAVRDGQ
ncbi:MAG: hypothetical protein ABIQ32_07070 [Sphingomicrobium sp.]